METPTVCGGPVYQPQAAGVTVGFELLADVHNEAIGGQISHALLQIRRMGWMLRVALACGCQHGGARMVDQCLAGTG